MGEASPQEKAMRSESALLALARPGSLGSVVSPVGTAEPRTRTRARPRATTRTRSQTRARPRARGLPETKGPEGPAWPHRGRRHESHGRRWSQLCLSHSLLSLRALRRENWWQEEGNKLRWHSGTSSVPAYPSALQLQEKPAPPTLESSWSRQKHNCPRGGVHREAGQGGWVWQLLAGELLGSLGLISQPDPPLTPKVETFCSFQKALTVSAQPGAVSHAVPLPPHPLWVLA